MMMSNMQWLLSIFIFFGFSLRGYALPFVISDADQILNQRSLGLYLQVLDEKAGAGLGIDEILKLPDSQWQSSSKEQVNRGLVKDSLWARLSLENRGLQTRSLVIASHIPIRWLVYAQNEDQTWTLHKPGQDEDVRNKNFLQLPQFAFELAPGVKNIIFRVDGDFGTLDIGLWDRESRAQHVSMLQAQLGAIFGMFVMLLLSNLFLALTLRKNYYFYYIAYIATHIVCMTFVTGTHRALFSLFHLASPDFLIIACIECLLVTLFTMSLFDTKKQMPRLHLLFIAVGVGYVIVFPLRMIAPFAGVTLYIITLYFGISTAMIATFVGIWQKRRLAYLYALGWGCTFVGAGFYLAARLGFTPITEFSETVLLWGSLWEMLILSLAVGDRYYRDAKTKEATFSAIRDAKNQQFLRLTGEVAHEINNPLAIISGYSSLAEKELSKTDPNATLALRMVQRIGANSHRVERVISMLKNIADSSNSPKVQVAIIGLLHEAWVDCAVISERALPVFALRDEAKDLSILGYPVLLRYAFAFIFNYAVALINNLDQSLNVRVYLEREALLVLEVSVPGVFDRNAIEDSVNHLQLTLGPLIETILEIHAGRFESNFASDRSMFVLKIPV